MHMMQMEMNYYSIFPNVWLKELLGDQLEEILVQVEFTGNCTILSSIPRGFRYYDIN